MKKILFLSTFNLVLITFAVAQEYATFTNTGLNQGKGTFSNAALSNFTWIASGALAKDVEILNNEGFDDGNMFESAFGQADNEENLRIKADTNGANTSGLPILSKVRLVINFDSISPVNQWGFCVVDIEVENCLISAIDENNNEVPSNDISKWLVELFDANLIKDSINIPKWDSTHAALLGSSTPANYTVYDSLVIGGMPDSEAASAFFMPDIPLKSLTIDYENLQQSSTTSYHFYIASSVPTSISEILGTKIAVYPNPILNEFRIAGLQKSQPVQIKILDMTGKIQIEKSTLSEDVEVIDVSNLRKGIYLLTIIQNGEMVNMKIAK